MLGLARRLATILPAKMLAEALEPSRRHRVACRTTLVPACPFQAPHDPSPTSDSLPAGLYQYLARCYWRITASCAWMRCRSASATASRSCATRSRREFCHYNLSGTLEFAALATVAGRTARPQSSPTL